MDLDTHVCEITRPTSLERLLTLEETTDVTLVGADGKNPLRAHKAVLASASEFFMGMFFGEARESWEENAAGVVTLEGFSSEAVRRIVDIVYIGRLEVSPSQGYKTLLELVGASDFFNIPQLKEACDYFLRRYGREIVQKEFQSFSLPLLRKVLASDALGCEEIAIFKAVEQWIEEHKTSLGDDDIKEISGMVRYGLIPAKELLDIVGKSKWKDEALFLAALDNWIEPDVSKIKVPQHLARANTFPLLPFRRGAFFITVNDGVYLYQIDPPHREPFGAGPGRPNAGVLLAVDNLEVPINLCSEGQRLSFLFSVFPANEQAIAFSSGEDLSQDAKLFKDDDHTITVTHSMPVLLQPSPIGQLRMNQGQLFEGLHSTPWSGMLGSASKFCISKDKDAVVIAEPKSGGGRTIRYEICSTAAYVLIGMKVEGSATLKQVPNS